MNIKTFLKPIPLKDGFELQVVEWNYMLREDDYEFRDRDLYLQRDLLREELKELEVACEAKDTVGIVDAICDIVFVNTFLNYLLNGRFKDEVYKDVRGECSVSGEVAKSLMHSLDLPWDELFQEVVSSNMSKFIELELLDQEALKAADEECHSIIEKYEDVEDCTARFVHQDSGSIFAVFMDQNGKVRKPSTFRNPDLETILNDFQSKLPEESRD